MIRELCFLGRFLLLFLLICINFPAQAEVVNGVESPTNTHKNFFSISEEAQKKPEVKAESAINNPYTIAPILNDVLPSIVNLSVTKKFCGGESVNLDSNVQKFFEEFFGQNFNFRFKAPESDSFKVTASGVIIDAKNGYVITNHHVVSDATEIFVTMNDNRFFHAKVLGSDQYTDIAVLQILEGKNLTECKIGKSKNLRVGDFVVAIGNPFALSHTVTSGIVSALGRTILDTGTSELIQTDASINPGNSGGALINFQGELIGINTAIYTPKGLGGVGGNIGIGFAIPSDVVSLVSKQLIDKGFIERGRIGVEVQSLTPEMIHTLDIPKNFITGGAIITKVVKDSSAAKAGLKVEDIIISVDGVAVNSNLNLVNLISLRPLGEKVNIKVMRGKKTLDFVVPIAKWDGNKSEVDFRDIELLRGVYFSNISSEHEIYGKVEGVIVTKIESNSKISKSGLLAKGDVVLSVNQERVKSVTDLQNILKKVDISKGLLLNLLSFDNGHFNGNISSRFVVIK